MNPGVSSKINEANAAGAPIATGFTHCIPDGMPAVEGEEPGFWGHSSGKWEGNDVVVETVGIKEHPRLRNAPHSAAMRTHERMRIDKR